MSEIMHSKQGVSEAEKVFEELLSEWWDPIYDGLCEHGGGQPAWSSARFWHDKREKWRQRFREGQAADRLHEAQETLR